MSPRELTLGGSYVTALVPAWQAQFAADGSSTLTDSWTAGAGPVTLPCFDSWTFRTTADPGDFATIVRRLKPLTAAETAQQFGRTQVGVGPPGVQVGSRGRRRR